MKHLIATRVFRPFGLSRPHASVTDRGRVAPAGGERARIAKHFLTALLRSFSMPAV
jgi:hypothetical protein